MKNIPTFEDFINENINEASFTENMSKETLEVYRKYAKLIDVSDPNAINSHKKLGDTITMDPDFINNKQKQLLQRALNWAMTFAIEQER
jgi:hypothetical protein